MNACMCVSVWVTWVIYGCLWECDSTMKNAENSNFVKNDSNERRWNQNKTSEKKKLRRKTMGTEAHKLWDFFHCRRACLIWHRNASKMNFADVNVNAVPPGPKYEALNEFSHFHITITNARPSVARIGTWYFPLGRWVYRWVQFSR